MRWTGPGLAQLWPRDARWVNVWLEDGGQRLALPAPVTVTDASGAAMLNDAIEMDVGAEVRVRVDFGRAVARLPRGAHRVCYGLSVTTFPDAPQRGTTRECLPIVILEPQTQRERAEYLRRQAIDLVSQLRCDEALPVIEHLLRVHPSSAFAFRLRGIVEELQQRNEAAVSDYGRAIQLLRTGGDHLLPASGIDPQESARALANWRDSIALLLTYAPELSMLGPLGERPTCRSSAVP